MTPVEAAAIAAIQAHANNHRKSGRATFSIAGIDLLLGLLAASEARAERLLHDRDEYMALFADANHRLKESLP